MSAGESASTERAALIALANCVEPADALVGRLVSSVGAIGTLDRLRAQSTGIGHEEGILARLARFESSGNPQPADVRIITRVDRDWPTQLDDLGHTKPLALWVAGSGSLRLMALRSLAVVGARACTLYGEEVARGWAADISSAGWTIVSGGAYGIDAAAHRGALAADAPTICVVAGGVDVPYPRGHDSLLARIAADGLIVSETPPAESVRRQRFLTRNRLIASLTRATLVVEAAVRSGTTATARAARDLNRPVLAVPGPVSSPLSAGCHRMIRDEEAILVTSPGDVVGLLDLGAVATEAGADSRVLARDQLGQRERRVLDALPSRGDASLDDLVVAAGLAVGDTTAALGILEADGWIRSAPQGWQLTRRR